MDWHRARVWDLDSRL